jgi:uncharacterized membrane protein (DUF485 family)
MAGYVMDSTQLPAAPPALPTWRRVLRTACVFLLIFFVVSILFIPLNLFLPGGTPTPSGMGTITFRIRLLNGEVIIALVVASVFARRYWRTGSLKRVRKPWIEG